MVIFKDRLALGWVRSSEDLKEWKDEMIGQPKSGQRSALYMHSSVRMGECSMIVSYRPGELVTKFQSMLALKFQSLPALPLCSHSPQLRYIVT